MTIKTRPETITDGYQNNLVWEVIVTDLVTSPVGVSRCGSGLCLGVELMNEPVLRNCPKVGHQVFPISTERLPHCS